VVENLRANLRRRTSRYNRAKKATSCRTPPGPQKDSFGQEKVRRARLTHRCEDQPRGGAKIRTKAQTNTAERMTQQKASIRFARFFFWPLSRMIVATTSMKEKETRSGKAGVHI